DERAHRGVVVRRAIDLLDVGVTQQLAAHLAAPAVGLALGHTLLLCGTNGEALSLRKVGGKSNGPTPRCGGCSTSCGRPTIHSDGRAVRRDRGGLQELPASGPSNC